MKKRIVSIFLVLAMTLGVVSSGFAAKMPNGNEIEPHNNRYYYVTEYSSPDYKVESVRSFTVEDYEAAVVAEAVGAGLLGVVAAAIPGHLDDVSMAPYITRVVSQLALFYTSLKTVLLDDDIFYTVTVSSRHEYRYQVDRLDETNRHCVSEKIHFKVVTEYIDGSTDVKTDTIIMK